MLRFITAVVCLATLTACGLRGPLYLPENTQAAAPAQTAPAAQNPAAKQ